MQIVETPTNHQINKYSRN